MTLLGASQLVVTTEPPANVGAGNSFTVGVSEEDAYGNVETADNTTVVSLALVSNPGGSTLSCTNAGGTSATVSGGVATFTCSLNVLDNGYSLGATSGSLSPATTNAFNVVAPIRRSERAGHRQLVWSEHRRKPDLHRRQ